MTWQPRHSHPDLHWWVKSWRLVALSAWSWVASLHTSCSRINVPVVVLAGSSAPAQCQSAAFSSPCRSPLQRQKRGLYPKVCACSSVIGGWIYQGRLCSISFELSHLLPVIKIGPGHMQGCLLQSYSVLSSLLRNESFDGRGWVGLLLWRSSLSTEKAPRIATVRWQQLLPWMAKCFNGAGLFKGMPNSQRRCWAVLHHPDVFDPDQEPCHSCGQKGGPSMDHSGPQAVQGSRSWYHFSVEAFVLITPSLLRCQYLFVSR